jgi:hypothetical protein
MGKKNLCTKQEDLTPLARERYPNLFEPHRSFSLSQSLGSRIKSLSLPTRS